MLAATLLVYFFSRSPFSFYSVLSVFSFVCSLCFYLANTCKTSWNKSDRRLGKLCNAPRKKKQCWFRAGSTCKPVSTGSRTTSLHCSICQLGLCRLISGRQNMDFSSASYCCPFGPHCLSLVSLAAFSLFLWQTKNGRFVIFDGPEPLTWFNSGTICFRGHNQFFGSGNR